MEAVIIEVSVQTLRLRTYPKRVHKAKYLPPTSGAYFQAGFHSGQASYLNPLNPIMHFWLHHTVHCTEKIVSTPVASASAERVGQGEVGGVTCRVTCTWWLLGLAVKAPWLGPGGSILPLATCTGLENAALTF